MDRKTVNKPEREIEQAIAGVIMRLGHKKLPLLPSQGTMRLMAKAAVAVYETAVAGEKDDSAKESEAS